MGKDTRYHGSIASYWGVHAIEMEAEMTKKVPPRQIDPLLSEQVEIGLIPWWFGVIVSLIAIFFVVLALIK